MAEADPWASAVCSAPVKVSPFGGATSNLKLSPGWKPVTLNSNSVAARPEGGPIATRGAPGAGLEEVEDAPVPCPSVVVVEAAFLVELPGPPQAASRAKRRTLMRNRRQGFRRSRSDPCARPAVRAIGRAPAGSPAVSSNIALGGWQARYGRTRLVSPAPKALVPSPGPVSGETHQPPRRRPGRKPAPPPASERGEGSAACSAAVIPGSSAGDDRGCHRRQAPAAR